MLTLPASSDTTVGSYSPFWVLKSRKNDTKLRENIFLSPKFCHSCPGEDPLGWWDSGVEFSALPEVWSNFWSSEEFPAFPSGTPGTGKEQRLHPVFIYGLGIPREPPLGGGSASKHPQNNSKLEQLRHPQFWCPLLGPVPAPAREKREARLELMSS